MHLHRLFQNADIHVNALYLIDCRPVSFPDNSVGPAFHQNFEAVLLHTAFQRHLRQVAGTHLFLDFAVHTASRQHCLLLIHSRPSII